MAGVCDGAQPGFETVYQPTDGTLCVNLAYYAELSFQHGPTFFANAVGQYEATQIGLWRPAAGCMNVLELRRMLLC